VIEHYAFGSIEVDGKKYNHDLIISSAGIKDWWRHTSHEVSINDLEPILAEDPKTIIFGTGALGAMKVLSETEDYIEKNKNEILIFKTAEAVKEFNQRDRQPGVVGAFHLTC
jgi:hypothetical protein